MLTETVYEDQCKYRLVWYCPDIRDAQYGKFLFMDPAEARGAEVAVKKTYPDYVVWLEDRDGNRVAIPR